MSLKTAVKRATEKTLPQQYEFTAIGSFAEIMAVLSSLKQNAAKIVSAMEFSEHVELLKTIEFRLDEIEFAEGEASKMKKQILLGEKIANAVNMMNPDFENLTDTEFGEEDELPKEILIGRKIAKAINYNGSVFLES